MRRRRVLPLALVLVGTATVWASLPATDPFNGTPGNPLSANWTTQVAGWVIETGGTTARPSSSGTYQSVFWNADAFNNDQYSEVVISAIGGQMGPMVRVSGTGSGVNGYWLLGRTGASSYIYTSTNGTHTQLVDLGTIAWTAGDTMRLEVSGTTITAKRNGSTIGSPATSSAHASGAAGMLGLDVSDVVTTWNGGNLGAGGAASPCAVLLLGVCGESPVGAMREPGLPRSIGHGAQFGVGLRVNAVGIGLVSEVGANPDTRIRSRGVENAADDVLSRARPVGRPAGADLAAQVNQERRRAGNVGGDVVREGFNRTAIAVSRRRDAVHDGIGSKHHDYDADGPAHRARELNHARIGLVRFRPLVGSGSVHVRRAFGSHYENAAATTGGEMGRQERPGRADTRVDIDRIVGGMPGAITAQYRDGIGRGELWMQAAAGRARIASDDDDVTARRGGLAAGGGECRDRECAEAQPAMSHWGRGV